MIHNSTFTDISVFESRGHHNIEYKARRFGQWWMLKGLKPEFRNNPFYRNLLKKEFDLVSSMNHPNIVGAFAFHEDDELGPYMVCEYIQGIPLDEFLKQNPPYALKMKILHEIVSALNYSSSMQVVHRDVKPSNIIVTDNGNNVKLIDFGLSDADSYDFSKTPAGTLKYMAPEQQNHDVEIDVRADIYSLGRIIDEMNLPHQYHYVIAKKCTQEDRSKRYDSFSEVERDISRVEDMVRIVPRQIFDMFLMVIAFVVMFYLGRGSFGDYVLGYHDYRVAEMPIPEEYYNDTTQYSIHPDYAGYFLPQYDFMMFLRKPKSSIPGNISEDKAVDLGLSVKWAPFNVGCDHESLVMVGSMIGFGDVTGRATDDGNFSLYYRHNLDRAHDIASMKWGGHWRTPTKKEWEELMNNCQWRLFINKGYVPCYLVTGRNGNSIVLPAGGFRYKNSFFDSGNLGCYWTADIVTNGGLLAYAFYFNRDNLKFMEHGVVNGMAVRPVLAK